MKVIGYVLFPSTWHLSAYWKRLRAWKYYKIGGYRAIREYGRW